MTIAYELVEAGDRTFKVKKFLELLNDHFMQWGICDQDISIDETIVPYFGRSALKQFIRGKPIRFGFKHWCLADKLGYCYRLQLYAGRDPLQPRNNVPLGTHVVNKLLTACVSDPDSVELYLDNFFTSVKLLDDLADQDIRTTGTLRRNRIDRAPLKNDHEMKRQDRGFHDFRFHTSREVLLVRWNDNAIVTVGTNFDAVTPLRVVQRRGRGVRNTVSQPAMIAKYKSSMGV